MAINVNEDGVVKTLQADMINKSVTSWTCSGIICVKKNHVTGSANSVATVSISPYTNNDILYYIIIFSNPQSSQANANTQTVHIIRADKVSTARYVGYTYADKTYKLQLGASAGTDKTLLIASIGISSVSLDIYALLK